MRGIVGVEVAEAAQRRPKGVNATGADLTWQTHRVRSNLNELGISKNGSQVAICMSLQL